MSSYFKTLVFLCSGLLAVFGWHFATVLGLLGSAPQTRGEFFVRIGLILIGFLIVSVLSAVMVSKHSEREAVPDEREEEILLKTERIGVGTLYIGLLVIIWLVFSPLTPMQVANAVLAVICLSEFAKIVYGIIIHNRQI